MDYELEKTVSFSTEEAEDRLTEAMKKEGFGLVSRIDMQSKFHDKLEVEHGVYTILGYCNARLAYDAIQSDDNIGLLLPCNALVFERSGNTVVSIIKPTVAMSMVENEKLAKMAGSIEEGLKKVMEHL